MRTSQRTGLAYTLRASGMNVVRIVLVLAVVVSGVGCTESAEQGIDAQDDIGGDANTGPDAPTLGGSDAEGARCTTPGAAIVTDIDATMTTSDSEWIMQIIFGDHDPAERPGASDMIQAYSDRGYYIFYLTSRPETITLGGTGESARDATMRWLTEHDFPVAPDRSSLQLAPELVQGDASAAYKGGALTDMQDSGFRFHYAYGNATSDIDGYDMAGIAKSITYIIGPEAGVDGTQPIEQDGWIEHIAAHVDGLATICSW